MPFVEVVQERDMGIVSPPWETAPNGVVSLLAMLEFSARNYVELAYQFGLTMASLKDHSPQIDSFERTFTRLAGEAEDLGLLVTHAHIERMLKELVLDAQGQEAPKNERICYHIETIYATLQTELDTIHFKAIPKERSRYNNSEWLNFSLTMLNFPTSFKELDRAGSCYSLGQPTASVFHSMRALEPALSVLARHFNVSAAHENWNVIIEQIESAVRSLGQQPKSQQKIDDETFFGAATSHLYFVKNAWRNHVAHARGSYSDDESVRILLRTQEFIESLCPRFQE
jgi:hypothetical protein